MSWIYLAIGGYFFLALAALGDRLLLASSTVNPAKYVYIIALLGGFGGIIISTASVIFSGLTWLNFIIPENHLYIFGSAFAAGIFYVLALFAYFYILNKVEASRVVPSIGAFIPIFTLVLATSFLDTSLTLYHLAAFFVLVFGAFLVSYKDKTSSLLLNRSIIFVLFSAFFFSLHFTFVKNAYNHLPFIEALVFVQFGFVLAGFILYALFNKKFVYLENKKDVVVAISPIFVFANQAVGFAGGGLLQFAVFGGNVVFVNAMQGVQYAFLFVILFIASRFLNKFLNESYSKRVLIQKLAGIILIAFGIILISFSV